MSRPSPWAVPGRQVGVDRRRGGREGGDVLFSGPAFELVEADVAAHDVAVAGAAVDVVAAVAAGDRVGAAVAVERVVAEAAGDGVVARRRR